MTKPLIWDEDEQSLADSARDWVAAEHPVARFRALRDAGHTWDRAAWAELLELGWCAVGLGEAHGGMGLAARVILCEALGGGLAATPLVSAWLTADLDPEADVGLVRPLCWEEAGGRADPERTQSVVRDGRLTGSKVNVLDPGAADCWLVTARHLGEVALYRVPRDHGLVATLCRVDHRDAANVSFDGAPAVRVCGLPELRRALDRARIALSAEMLGGSEAALRTTLEYVRERQQFGVAIGSFQAVQHRLVDCFIPIELCRSAVVAASREPTAAAAALAKALTGDTYLHVARESIQFHGGIGVTDECDVGFHLKRAHVADRVFGPASSQRDAWGRAAGF